MFQLLTLALLYYVLGDVASLYHQDVTLHERYTWVGHLLLIVAGINAIIYVIGFGFEVALRLRKLRD